MKKWFRNVRSQLLEILGDDYQSYVRTEKWLYGVFFPTFFFFMILSYIPIFVRIIGGWVFLTIFIFIFVVAVFIDKRWGVKLDREKKKLLKKTSYRWIIGAIVGLMMFSQHIIGNLIRFQYEFMSIPKAIEVYQESVFLPTYLPFEPKSEYAHVSASPFYYDLKVFYAKDSQLLTLFISKDEPDNDFKTNQTLQNGRKVKYELWEDVDDQTKNQQLTWYQNDLEYELHLSSSSKLTKEEFLKIANSFQLVQP